MKATPVPEIAKEQIHSCSYYCERPECIKAQRDALVKSMDLDGMIDPRRIEITDTRAKALEEAAKICERPNKITGGNKLQMEWLDGYYTGAKECEDAIRAAITGKQP